MEVNRLKEPLEKSDLKDDMPKEIYYIVTIKPEYIHKFVLTTVYRR